MFFFRLISNRAVWWLPLHRNFWVSDKNAFAVRYLKGEKELEHQKNIIHGADWGPRNNHLGSTDHVSPEKINRNVAIFHWKKLLV